MHGRKRVTYIKLYVSLTQITLWNVSNVSTPITHLITDLNSSRGLIFSLNRLFKVEHNIALIILRRVANPYIHPSQQ